MLDRRLFTAMSYPADYGFVEGTLAEDGDPLDALVLLDEPTFPGCHIRVRAGRRVLDDRREGPRREDASASRSGDPVWSSVHDIHDIPPELRDEIEHFFQVYKDLEEAKTETRGFGNRSEAVQIIADAARAWSTALTSASSATAPSTGRSTVSARSTSSSPSEATTSAGV